MFKNIYPYTDFHDLNLDWIINQVKQLETEIKDFVKLNTIKYANPILWNITMQYEANTVTIDGSTGNAYISTVAVPAGVSISNTDYWTGIYNYEARLEPIITELSEVSKTVEDLDVRVTNLENRPDRGFYTTVAELRAATDLVNDTIVHTAGYYTVNDGGGATYYIRNKVITDVETYDKLVIGDFVAELLYHSKIDILQLGAKPDNSTDVSDIIEYALTKAIVYIPAGTYRVEKAIMCTKQPKIHGDNCTLQGYTTTSIIDIANTVDSRHGYIRGVGFTQNGTGHCIYFHSTTHSVIEFEISDCQMLVDYAGNGGYCVYADSDLSKCYISHCNFAGNGMYMKCFDANSITNCLFYGGANSTGVMFDIQEDGVEDNTIEQCVLVNAGYDLRIRQGEHIIVRNNQFECLATSAQTVTPAALIYIEGSANKPCNQIILAENNIGGNGYVSYGIYINNAKQCVLDGNCYAASVLADIFFSAYSMNNYVSPTNESRDRTSSDAFQKILITDNGTGNMGVYRKITLAVGGTATYYKDLFGNVHFVGGVYCNTLAQNAVVCTMPIGFRPTDTAYAYGGTSAEPVTFKISFDGTITCVSPVTSQSSLYIGDYQASKY